MGFLGIFKKKNKTKKDNKHDNVYNETIQYNERTKKAAEDMKLGKSANFKLIINAPHSIYNCIVYKTRDDIKVAYFGYGLDNSCADSLAISICTFLVNSFRKPNNLIFMRFDQEPGNIQISAINNEIYIADEDATRDRIVYPIENKDEVIKYSYHVDINIYDCARQVIEDVEQSTDIIFNEVNEGIELFDRYLETLKLIIKTQKTKLDPNEDSRLKQNLTIIEEYESALERFMAFRRTVSHAFIKDMSQEERKTYEELQEQLDTAAKKFQ